MRTYSNDVEIIRKKRKMEFAKTYSQLTVNVYSNRSLMGKAAAEHVAGLMRQLLSKQEFVTMVFAAAPSQNEFLDHLTQIEGLEWKRVIGFHMDEYIGLDADADQLFSKYLARHLFSRVMMREAHIINSQTGDPAGECRRYAELLRNNPIDIVCMGIGENGHVAFNDPPVADFDDTLMAKIVALDLACRRQQVNDGCFRQLSDVPKQAMTLTVPTLMSAKHLSIVVPTDRKAAAVHEALMGPVTTACPASILRNHPDAKMFLDIAAASGLSSN